jgi:hypothetical protein
MTSLRVQVKLNRGGKWDVVLPGGARVTCGTLDEAKRVAYLSAPHQHPCELIVQDAYHRVLHHERIGGDATPSYRPQQRLGSRDDRPDWVILERPRCGLSIRPRADRLTIEYCPRCIARTRTLVQLFSSTLPPAELYAADSVPNADARGGTTFAALHRRNYRLYFIGQAISLVGTWMQSVALSWLVLELTHSGTMIGLVVAAQFLPVLLLGACGALIADRVSKGRC